MLESLDDQIRAINNFLSAAQKWKIDKSLDAGNVRLSQQVGQADVTPHRGRKIDDFLRSGDFFNQNFLTDELKTYVENFQKANLNLERSISRDAKALGKGLESALGGISSYSGTSRAHFSRLGDEVLTNYFRSFQATMESLNRENATGNKLSVDPRFLEPIGNQVKESYKEMMGLYAILESIGDQGGDLDAYESQLYSTTIGRMLKSQKEMDKIREGLDQSVSVAEAFKHTAEEKAQQISANYSQREYQVKAIVRNLKRGDLLGVTRNASALIKGFKKKGPAYNNAQKETSKAMGKIGAVMMGLAMLEVTLKSIKNFVSLLFGINDYNNEFNNKLFKKHGFLSQGIDINFSINDTSEIKKKYIEIQSFFEQFGAQDIKDMTILSEDDLLNITAAFEKEGKRFHQVAGNYEEFKSTIYTTLKGKYALGLSLEESASLIANWQHQVGLDISQTSGLIGTLHGVVQDSGFPINKLLESMNTLNSDYGLTIDRFNTVLGLQNAAQKKGRLTSESNYKAVNTLLDHLRGMNPSNWAKLVEPLLQSGRMTELVHSEIARLDEISANATDPMQKSKTALASNMLRESLKQQEFFQVRALQQVGSEETLLRIFQEGMNAHLGKTYKEQLKNGVFTKGTEVTFQAILGLAGDRSSLELFKEAAYIVNESPLNFALHPIQGKVDKNMKSNVDDHAKLGAEIAAAIKNTSTITEMREAVFRKWVSEFNEALGRMLSNLKGHWTMRLFGLDPNNKKEIQEALSQAKGLVTRINEEKDEGKQDQLIAVLKQRLTSMGEMGSDLNAVIRELLEVPVSGKLMNLFREFMKTPQMDYGGGGEGFGGSGIDYSYAGQLSSLKPEDYNADMGSKIAARARQITALSSSKLCLTYAHIILNSAIGMRVVGPADSAYQYMVTMSRDKRFREIPYTKPQDMLDAPPGSVFIWNRNPKYGSYHGHIAVSGGDGFMYSDFKQRITPEYYGRTLPRIWVPVKQSAAQPAKQNPTIPAPKNVECKSTTHSHKVTNNVRACLVKS